jgi:hyperosmotically inducible protein
MKAKLTETPHRPGFGIESLKHVIGTSVALAAMILMTGCAGDRMERTAGETIDDQATSTRVQNALSSDPAYKFTEVKVATMQGKVQLSGFVDKDEQKDRAAEIAKKTQGVKDVKNDIALK